MRTLIACLCSASLLFAGCSKTKTGNGKTGGSKAGKNRADWPMDEFKGKNPVLIAAVHEPSNPTRQKFFAAWPSVEADAKKHGLVIVEIVGLRFNSTGRIRGGRAFSQQEANNMRDAYGGGQTYFTVTLVGKDGKTIKKFTNPTNPKDVIDLLK